MDAEIFNEEEEGILPHQFLLKIARGEGVQHSSVKQTFNDDGVLEHGLVQETIVYPTFEQRLDAAHKCASYFAPKLSATNVAQTVALSEPEQVSTYIKTLLEALPN